MPGLLTTGDVDLHVRVEPHAFAAARDVLCKLYEPLYQDCWNESAYFFDPGAEPRVEISLTEIGTSMISTMGRRGREWLRTRI